MAIQPSGVKRVKGTREILEQYTDGLTDLKCFSRIILMDVIRNCDSGQLIVTRFLEIQFMVF